MSRDHGDTSTAPEHKGAGRVTGVVTSVSEPKEFDLRTRKQATISKDYRHVTISIKNGKHVKIYFPVTANVSGLGKRGSIYSRSGFTKIQGENGDWIDYQIFNPNLLIGKTVEVTGDVTKNIDGNYYMNKLSELKVFQ